MDAPTLHATWRRTHESRYSACMGELDQAAAALLWPFERLAVCSVTRDGDITYVSWGAIWREHTAKGVDMRQYRVMIDRRLFRGVWREHVAFVWNHVSFDGVYTVVRVIHRDTDDTKVGPWKQAYLGLQGGDLVALAPDLDHLAARYWKRRDRLMT